MRGSTLGEMVTMLRSEIGASVNSALGVNMLETLKYHLRKQQERLYHEYDWPFLKGDYDVSLQAGQRYYDLPVDPERIKGVTVKWNGIWSPLPYGIKPSHYNSTDSDTDQRLDPAQAWDFYLDPDGADSTVDNIQFEVWPIPATDDQVTVRFRGIRALPALTSENAKAILDDYLIVLYAAAKLVPAKDRRDKLAEAQAHFSTMKRRSKKGGMYVLGGGEDANTRPPPGPVRVAVSQV